MKIRFLKANNGDCVLLTFQSSNGVKNVLIDGGTAATYVDRGTKRAGDLKSVINEIRAKGEFIDLLIVTHIDDDHIGGIINFIGKDKEAKSLIKEVWFNSGRIISEYLKNEINPDLDIHLADPESFDTSIKQGILFDTFLKDSNIPSSSLLLQGQKIEWHDLIFKILSPNREKLEKLLKEWKKEQPDFDTASKQSDYAMTLEEHIATDTFDEDKAYPNGSSIAFIIEHKNLTFVFLADSHPSVVCEGLASLGFDENSPLTADFLKLSHHGSNHNNSEKLIRSITTNNYVISTNGSGHFHPHKKLIARILSIKPECNLIFNYGELINRIFLAEDYNKFASFQTSDKAILEYDI